MSAPEKIAPRSQASSSVWNPLVKAGFVPPEGREAILLHPDSGTTVYFLPPSAGMKVTSNWQVGETAGKGWSYLATVLHGLGVPLPDQKSGPPRKMNEAEQREQWRRDSAAIRGTGNNAVLNHYARPGSYEHLPSDSMPLIVIDVVLELSDGTTRIIQTQAKHLVGAVSTARGTAERTMTAVELAMVVAIRPKTS